MAWVDAVLASLRSVLPRPSHETAPDPFDTLWLQTRLGVLATEIRDLEASSHVFAKMHRLTAVRAAYDDLLADACRLAGVPGAEDEDLRGEALRWYAERELSARGWSW